MTDISKLFNYEAHYTLELRRPDTDEPLGVTFQVRSAQSEEAKKVQTKWIGETYGRLIRGKNITGESRVKEELEKAASFIVSWDWGTNTYNGKVPEFSMKTAIDIMEREGWIFQQVVEAANKIENFSPTSATSSALS